MTYAEPMWVPHLEELDLPLAQERTDATDLYPAVLESICGATDDSQPVEQYDGTLGVTTAFVAANQSMVAQVQWNTNLPYANPGNVAGARWGTGTMVSPDLFLTCGHLFDQTGGGWNRPRVDGTTNVISPQEIATNMHLNFNFQVDPSGTLRSEQSFAITQLIEYRLGGVDFAVCRIAGSPGNTFGFSAVATADAAPGDMLCIIGHPAGLPKRIEAGPLIDFNGNAVRYNDIDTLGGNSGSGILHATTAQIIGVHTNGGCNAQGTGSNFGMRVSAIRANSPTVRALGTGPTGVVADLRTTVDNDVLNPIDTLPVADQLRTTIRADVLRPIDTLPAADQLRTTIRADVPVNTTAVLDLNTSVALDRPIATGAFADRPPLGPDPRGPIVNPAIGRARPFVLSTPHHSPVLPEQPPQGSAEEYVSLLSELEVTLEQLQLQLAQLGEHYEALRDEYESLYNG